MQAETQRQVEHMVPVAFALLLRWIPLWPAAALAALSVVYAGFVSPRLLRRTLRDDEAPRGFSPGKVIYGAVVLALILILRETHFHVVAGAWALMGIGDGMSNIVGRRFGRTRIPWNREKSWEGFAAFLAFGTVAAGFLVWWVSLRRDVADLSILTSMVYALAAAAAAGLVETLPGRYVDDNITVPAVAAFVLYVVTVGFGMDDPTLSLFVALALNFVLGFAAYRSGAVDTSGLVAGLAIGTAVAVTLGLPGFLLLALMFVLGSGATRWGYARKKRDGIAQESGGRRGWLHAGANCVVPASCAVLAACYADTFTADVMKLAFAAALATAAMDTVSSELGPLYGRVTVLPPTFRRVKPGTDGAVSLEGTLLGLAGAAVVAAAAVALGLVHLTSSWLLLVGAFAGTTVESLLGAAGLGRMRLGGMFLNVVCTAVGAIVATVIGGLF